MRKFFLVKYIKRFIWFIIISMFIITTYIFLFVGMERTCIDDFCMTICLIFIEITMSIDFIIEQKGGNIRNDS